MNEQKVSAKPASFLDWVEKTGNRLPDPAVHFLIALLVTWALSALLAGVAFTEIDPRNGQPLQIQSQITGTALANFLTRMIGVYTGFPPLGLVMVIVLGVGVAEVSGLFGAALQRMLDVTPRKLLTPALATAAMLSHIVADAAVVAIVPLGGALFFAAGRHPLAGLMLTFACVIGAFAANLIPTGLDPLLQGFTQSAAQVIDPARTVNPLCNMWFMAFTSLPMIVAAWWITDKVIEPRLAATPIDGDPALLPKVHSLSSRERKALWMALASILALTAVLVAWALPADSALRGPDGSLSSNASPLMRILVPLMLFFTVTPGLAYGYMAGTIRSHKDAIAAMSKAISGMSYYLVLVFFAALFIFSFAESNLGALLALKGGNALKLMGLPPMITILGIILLTSSINLVVGSASAKWAMLAPILVPMLMTAGISPELTQIAYRIGDGPTNIVTPLLPYFPLLVAFSARYVKDTGIGTAISLMIPYAMAFLLISTLALGIYWGFDLPLGIQAGYTYP